MAMPKLTLEYLILTGLRFIQFILAIAVIGLYATDLHAAAKVGKYVDSKWGYAVFVGVLAAVVSLVHCIPMVARVPFVFVVDFLVCFLYIVLFGVFGALYIHENPEGDSGIQRMKNAVWVDLVNALLWLISAVYMLVYWFRTRGERTTFTGRGRVAV